MPGGVGPMTVTMLIENTLRSAERALRHAPDRRLPGRAPGSAGLRGAASGRRGAEQGADIHPGLSRAASRRPPILRVQEQASAAGVPEPRSMPSLRPTSRMRRARSELPKS